ncbi:MAG: tRNA (N(6)-L-threonylcarbamoyladenosine(37)-C(2))-methylthiotransferase MtaB [Candidatus Neomarinimicrobiota bacterium]|nr:tRNA (N(6)-L-threonylcarbamoyladenosine(37)-C(2))-methylthiotransferase MtaB [Candidatus Neomarinimicrobiota bacterium]
MSTQYKRVAFHTMGCKLNYSESSMISRDFVNQGFKKVDYKDIADIYVLNTCSVTENADREARKLIRQAKRKNPNATVAVMGCYAQLNPNEIAQIQGVDLVLGAENKFNLLDQLDKLDLNGTPKVVRSDIIRANSFIPSYSSKERTRSYLKIQDGCDYICSFCTIPLARGKSRSDTIANTLELARQALETGAREIVLTGVNVGDFGKIHNESFFELIQQIDDLPFDRIRISSIEPNLLTDEIIKFCASSKKFMPHFHIPLQSGSDKILSLMRRRYKRDQYKHCVSTIKKYMPDAAIGADVIVGFPGESDNDFIESIHFIDELDISYLHVFTYSERPNTDAINKDNTVDKKTRSRRSAMLRDLSYKKLSKFYDQYIGSSRFVLFESMKNGKAIGHTDNYILVSIDVDSSAINSIQNVRLNQNQGSLVNGELDL